MREFSVMSYSVVRTGLEPVSHRVLRQQFSHLKLPDYKKLWKVVNHHPPKDNQITWVNGPDASILSQLSSQGRTRTEYRTRRSRQPYLLRVGDLGPSRITSTWLFTPLHQVNGLTAIWEWGFPVISGLRGTGRNRTADTLSFNQVLYHLSYRSLFFVVWTGIEPRGT